MDMTMALPRQPDTSNSLQSHGWYNLQFAENWTDPAVQVEFATLSFVHFRCRTAASATTTMGDMLTGNNRFVFQVLVECLHATHEQRRAAVAEGSADSDDISVFFELVYKDAPRLRTREDAATCNIFAGGTWDGRDGTLACECLGDPSIYLWHNDRNGSTTVDCCHSQQVKIPSSDIGSDLVGGYYAGLIAEGKERLATANGFRVWLAFPTGTHHKDFHDAFERLFAENEARVKQVSFSVLSHEEDDDSHEDDAPGEVAGGVDDARGGSHDDDDDELRRPRKRTKFAAPAAAAAAAQYQTAMETYSSFGGLLQALAPPPAASHDGRAATPDAPAEPRRRRPGAKRSPVPPTPSWARGGRGRGGRGRGRTRGRGHQDLPSLTLADTITYNDPRTAFAYLSRDRFFRHVVPEVVGDAVASWEAALYVLQSGKDPAWPLRHAARFPAPPEHLQWSLHNYVVGADDDGNVWRLAFPYARAVCRVPSSALNSFAILGLCFPFYQCLVSNPSADFHSYGDHVRSVSLQQYELAPHAHHHTLGWEAGVFPLPASPPPGRKGGQQQPQRSKRPPCGPAPAEIEERENASEEEALRLQTYQARRQREVRRLAYLAEAAAASTQCGSYKRIETPFSVTALEQRPIVTYLTNTLRQSLKAADASTSLLASGRKRAHLYLQQMRAYDVKHMNGDDPSMSVVARRTANFLAMSEVRMFVPEKQVACFGKLTRYPAIYNVALSLLTSLEKYENARSYHFLFLLMLGFHWDASRNEENLHGNLLVYGGAENGKSTCATVMREYATPEAVTFVTYQSEKADATEEDQSDSTIVLHEAPVENMVGGPFGRTSLVRQAKAKLTEGRTAYQVLAFLPDGSRVRQDVSTPVFGARIDLTNFLPREMDEALRTRYNIVYPPVVERVGRSIANLINAEEAASGETRAQREAIRRMWKVISAIVHGVNKRIATGALPNVSLRATMTVQAVVATLRDAFPFMGVCHARAMQRWSMLARAYTIVLAIQQVWCSFGGPCYGHAFGSHSYAELAPYLKDSTEIAIFTLGLVASESLSFDVAQTLDAIRGLIRRQHAEGSVTQADQRPTFATCLRPSAKDMGPKAQAITAIDKQAGTGLCLSADLVDMRCSMEKLTELISGTETPARGLHDVGQVRAILEEMGRTEVTVPYALHMMDVMAILQEDPSGSCLGVPNPLTAKVARAPDSPLTVRRLLDAGSGGNFHVRLHPCFLDGWRWSVCGPLLGELPGEDLAWLRAEARNATKLLKETQEVMCLLKSDLFETGGSRLGTLATQATYGAMKQYAHCSDADGLRAQVLRVLAYRLSEYGTVARPVPFGVPLEFGDHTFPQHSATIDLFQRSSQARAANPVTADVEDETVIDEWIQEENKNQVRVKVEGTTLAELVAKVLVRDPPQRNAEAPPPGDLQPCPLPLSPLAAAHSQRGTRYFGDLDTRSTVEAMRAYFGGSDEVVYNPACNAESLTVLSKHPLFLAMLSKVGLPQRAKDITSCTQMWDAMVERIDEVVTHCFPKLEEDLACGWRDLLVHVVFSHLHASASVKRKEEAVDWTRAALQALATHAVECPKRWEDCDVCKSVHAALVGGREGKGEALAVSAVEVVEGAGVGVLDGDAANMEGGVQPMEGVTRPEEVDLNDADGNACAPSSAAAHGFPPPLGGERKCTALAFREGWLPLPGTRHQQSRAKWEEDVNHFEGCGEVPGKACPLCANTRKKLGSVDLFSATHTTRHCEACPLPIRECPRCLECVECKGGGECRDGPLNCKDCVGGERYKCKGTCGWEVSTLRGDGVRYLAACGKQAAHMLANISQHPIGSASKEGGAPKAKVMWGDMSGIQRKVVLDSRYFAPVWLTGAELRNPCTADFAVQVASRLLLEMFRAALELHHTLALHYHYRLKTQRAHRCDDDEDKLWGVAIESLAEFMRGPPPNEMVRAVRHIIVYTGHQLSPREPLPMKKWTFAFYFQHKGGVPCKRAKWNPGAPGGCPVHNPHCVSSHSAAVPCPAPIDKCNAEVCALTLSQFHKP